MSLALRCVVVGLVFAPGLCFGQGLDEGGLFLEWVGVVDNGEGSGGVHGPLGNLHMEVWWPSGDGHTHEHWVLEGPTNDEFDDGDEASYHIYLGPWSMMFPNQVRFRVKIWESDPSSGTWNGLPWWIPPGIREHEVLFDQWLAGPGRYNSQWAAPDDAVRRAIQRGGNNWARQVWRGGIQAGIPKMFVQIKAGQVTALDFVD